MNKLTKIIFYLLFYSIGVKAQGSTTPNPIVSFFEDTETTNYIRAIFQKDIDSVYLYKIEDTGAMFFIPQQDNMRSKYTGLNLAIPDKQFIYSHTNSFIIKEFKCIYKTDEIHQISTILSNKYTYASAVKNTDSNIISITMEDCVDVISPFDYILVFYVNYWERIQLLLSSGNRKYALQFQDKNHFIVFTINESCLSSFGWDHLYDLGIGSRTSD